MSRLNKLYEAMETLRIEGLPVGYNSINTMTALG